MKKWIYVLCASAATCVSADSLNLFNDSSYQLTAIIYDASGNSMGEFVLKPRDASAWSDNDQNWGTEMGSASRVPYTVNWSCMSGSPYGSCTNVAAGSTVTAQSCGGVQECSSPSSSEDEE